MPLKKSVLTGKFLRTRLPWTPDTWNDGIKMKGRFAVYRPDCPRCYANGYALRAHVVWWLHAGKCHDKMKELHHKDHDKLNDHITNLEVLSKSEHRKRHQIIKLSYASCAHCQRLFQYPAWRDKERKTKFCSQRCYQNHPKSEESIAKRAASNTGRKRHPSFGLKMKAFWKNWRKKNK